MSNKIKYLKTAGFIVGGIVLSPIAVLVPIELSVIIFNLLQPRYDEYQAFGITFLIMLVIIAVILSSIFYLSGKKSR